MELPLEAILREIAETDCVYLDDTKVEAMTRHLVSRDEFCFQWLSVGPDPTMHHINLFNWFLPAGRKILDLGCGVGFSAHMFERICQKPLEFTMFNISEFQLTLCPDTFVKVKGDMRKPLPFENGSFDEVMMLYSLGHAGPLDEIMAECFRIIRPGGGLFIYDLSCREPMAFAEDLRYVTFATERVLEEAMAAGFASIRSGFPIPVFFNDPTGAMPQEKFTKYETIPVIYRFMRSPD